MMLAPELFRSRLREEGDATAGEETRAHGHHPGTLEAQPCTASESSMSTPRS
jgi:hypothetical protein